MEPTLSIDATDVLLTNQQGFTGRHTIGDSDDISGDKIVGEVNFGTREDVATWRAGISLIGSKKKLFLYRVEKLHVMRLRFRGQGLTPIGTRGPDTEIVSPHWP